MWEKEKFKGFSNASIIKGRKYWGREGGSGTLIDPKTELSPPKLHNSWIPSASFYLSVPPSLCLSFNSVFIVASWSKKGFFSQFTRWCKFSMRQEDKSGRSVVQRCNFASICLVFSPPKPSFVQHLPQPHMCFCPTGRESSSQRSLCANWDAFAQWASNRLAPLT